MRDPLVWEATLRRVASAAEGLGLAVVGATVSSLPGPSGNIEFFLHLRAGADPAAAAAPSLDRAVAGALDDARRLRGRTAPDAGDAEGSDEAGDAIEATAEAAEADGARE